MAPTATAKSVFKSAANPSEVMVSLNIPYGMKKSNSDVTIP